MIEHASANHQNGKPRNRREKRKWQTRQQLKRATAELLIAHGYDGFTVQDVTDAADLARGTFYVHFKDKEEAVWAILQDSFDALNEEFRQMEGGSSERRYFKWLRLFDYVEDNRELLMVMLGESGHIKLVRRMQDYIAAVIVDDTTSGSSDPIGEIPTDFAAEFIAGAMIRVIDWWLRQPPAKRYSASAMAVMFFQMVLREPLPQPLPPAHTRRDPPDEP